MSERKRIEQALTFDTGCEPSAQEIIDALSRAGYQITPGPGYDHSGNDNHLVAGDHGPVITPQAGEWQQECGSIGLQHQCGRCGCEYRSPPPQAGEAEPVATLHADGYWALNKKHPNYTDIQYQSERGNWRLPVYRTAPPRPTCDGNHAAPACADPECWQRPSPVAPMGYFVRDYAGELIPFACEADAREEAEDMGVAYIVAMPAPVAPEPTPEGMCRAALLWVLWHHQGGSSDVGQPIRFALGMGAHEPLSAEQVEAAKSYGALTKKWPPDSPGAENPDE